MRDEEKQLWLKIKSFLIDDPNSEFSFTDRLSRENSWSLEYSNRVVLEYKKFLFLICISNHPVTPSDQVDQAWHLHLLYTESYWVDLCQDILNRQIHHGPTRGGSEEKDKYVDWYQKTKNLYEDTFGAKAPEDIWPTSTIRFGNINFTRVNLHQNWVFPKLSIFKKWKF